MRRDVRSVRKGSSNNRAMSVCRWAVMRRCFRCRRARQMESSATGLTESFVTWQTRDTRGWQKLKANTLSKDMGGALSLWYSPNHDSMSFSRWGLPMTRSPIIVRLRFHKTDFSNKKIFSFSFYMYVFIKLYIFILVRKGKNNILKVFPASNLDRSQPRELVFA